MLPNCPKCNSEYTYEDGSLLICPECGHEWTAASQAAEEEAKQIVLSHAGLTSNQVTFKRTELDFDYGIQKYEVEFYYNNREYSYEINAKTGTILSYKQD